MSYELKILRPIRNSAIKTLSYKEKLILNQVSEISKNARAIYFALIGTLLFCIVTLVGIEDRHFFEYGADTKLPIIGVFVDTEIFFWTTPFLITVLFSYTHIYLDKLWIALSRLSIKINDLPSVELVYPWLISDVALSMRSEAGRNPFSQITVVVTTITCWLFGPLVVFLFWVRSWPAHNEVLTCTIGVQLLVVIAVSGLSFLRMFSMVSNRVIAFNVHRFGTLTLLVLGLGIGSFGYNKVEKGNLISLYRAKINNLRLVPKPSDWKSRKLAWRKYLKEIYHEEQSGFHDFLNEKNILLQKYSIENEFKQQRRSKLNPLEVSFSKIDLEQSYAQGAFMPGVFLHSPKISGADFSGSVMEEIQISGGDHANVVFEVADLQGADFSDLKFNNINFFASDLEDAYFSNVEIMNSTFSEATIRETGFSKTNISFSCFLSINFGKIYFWESVISYSIFNESNFDEIQFGARPNFNFVSVLGADLSQANFSQDDLEVMFGDASTIIDDELKIPNHWSTEKIDYEKRFFEWRKWIQERGGSLENFPEDAEFCDVLWSGRT